MRLSVGICVVLLLGISCTEYTPKPRGYFRIEPAVPRYSLWAEDTVPCTFQVSQLATVERSYAEGRVRGINLFYSSLGATLYCSYIPITPALLETTESECRSLVIRLSKNIQAVQEKRYSNPEKQVYGSLFLLDGTSASPIQFMLTDSISHFFRGALYYDCQPNADSLAPVTRYLRDDVLELIQSFSWKK